MVARLARSVSVEEDRKNNVDIHADQLGCRLLQLLDRLRPAKLNDEILALDVTESAQARPERLYAIRRSGSGPETEISDPRRLCRGCCARAASGHAIAAPPIEQHMKSAALHSMTSSARRRNDSGIVRPIAFAVLQIDDQLEFCRLLDREIGGLAPLSILST